MRLLTLEQLLELHALVISSTGGSDELRDIGRLESAIATQTQHVFGEELYPGILNKSAAIIRSIIADHPFVDGNKRTAILSALTFLEINNAKFEFKVSELEDFAVKVAVEKLDVPLISIWLEKHVSI